MIGAFAILEDNTCNFLCADFDDKSCEHGYQNDVLAYVIVCKEWNIPYLIERSRSGNGAHVWILFKTPIQAVKARRLGNSILTKATEQSPTLSFKSYDRLFPNQDRLPEGGFGNLVALPLQGAARKKGNSVFVNDEFVPFQDQWDYLRHVQKISEDKVNELLGSQSDLELGSFTTTSEETPWQTPIMPYVEKSDFGKQVTIIKANMLYLSLKSISAKVANHLKRIAAFKNPEFYAKQGMRLSTYNVPRIISCTEIEGDYLALPRGCEHTLVDLLKQYNVSYLIDDKTQHGHLVDVNFKGALRQDQAAAIEQLSSGTCGVLNATTAFGKTVAAIGLISRIKVNTLILVHNKALLDQWKERLEEFLDIIYTEEEQPKRRGRKKSFSPFGTLDSKGNSLHGQIDIALMQSCLDDDVLKPSLKQYGMVIIDECHHVSSVTFERILKQVTAHRVYGLTATPIRKDGHQPIIFMQCGQIVYSADSKSQMLQQSFDRLLNPRFTAYRQFTDDKVSYAKMILDISNDEHRNKMIVDDVYDAIKNGRTPIILTGTVSHVELLATELRKYLDNVVTLIGAESTKEKREKMAFLQSTPSSEPMVIVATGKYVGEGFDYPRLDTLFLAQPVSWKGIVAQYAGRLHREYPGKHNVVVYDYVDIHVPVCDNMYRRRLKGYAAIGYKVLNAEQVGLFATSVEAIYSGSSFLMPMLNDLSNACNSVIICVDKPWVTRSSKVIEMLKQMMSTKGITVVMCCKIQNEKSDYLNSMGITIRKNASTPINAVIIDKSIMWYGSINFLANSADDDHAIRITDTTLVNMIIDTIYSHR